MSKWKEILYYFLGFLIFLIYYAEGIDFTVLVEKLSVGHPKRYSLNSEIEYIIEITGLSEEIEKVPPRIFLECEECTDDHPLLIVVRQSKGVLSWELPVVIESQKYNTQYKKTERTLCPYNILNESNLRNENVDTNVTVTLSLSTSSEITVQVDLLVNLQSDFVIDLNSHKSVNVTPSSPHFFLYEFPPVNISSILIEVTSNDETCMIVSIQNVSCPVFDLEQNVQYRGHFQTVTQKGGLTLTKEAFPNGFYIVLIVSGEDDYCSSRLLSSNVERSKNIVISLSRTISSEEYKIAVLSTLVVILLFCVIMFTVHYYNYIREKKSVPDLDDLLDQDMNASTSTSQQTNNWNSRSPAPCTIGTVGTDSLSLRSDSSLDETDFDLASDTEFDKDIFRMKGYLYVSDLARKNQSILNKKSEMYFWNLLTVAIFYFLPVIQLVVTNQYQLNQSGKEDLCYYNFLCSHPLWFFSDFNHVFSNIGYVLLGSLFMMLTVMKERLYKIKIYSDRRLYRFYGIPQHFGLFYAMGAALIIEGIMSACYHICPNHYNFQFDSSFMYVICTLCMIKIYQSRHPDINATAYATFFLLAGVIFMGMFGVFSTNLAFWVVFNILHLSTFLYISLQIYYMGRWRFEYKIFERFFKELRLCLRCSWKFFMPTFPTRFLLLLVANSCNWCLGIATFIYDIRNFSSYLLVIFMVNLMLYTAFYILMKFICKERLLLRSLFYILLSVLGWASALYFFFNKTTSWRLTPAESKLYNQPCQLLDFYDNHDIWHFISAGAMFFSFMVLLTLDDDLTYIHRSKILVF